jgi:hypothetical protein
MMPPSCRVEIGSGISSHHPHPAMPRSWGISSGSFS